MGILSLKSKMEIALDSMLGRREIEGYEINIPLLDDPNMSVDDLANIILNGKIEGLYKLYQNGHTEELTIDASYALGGI